MKNITVGLSLSKDKEGNVTIKALYDDNVLLRIFLTGNEAVRLLSKGESFGILTRKEGEEA
jgi:hypothetical protein